MSLPKIAIVILNWNGVKLLKEFLPSVVKYSSADSIEIIVADNGSTDDSVKIIELEFPSIKIIELHNNYGFAKGYNEALKLINADYFVLINSDVEVTENWLDSPINLMEADSSIAAVQPKILSYLQKNQFEYAGAAGGFIDKYGYPFCRGRIFNVLEIDEGQYDEISEIFWASGACMFVRAKNFIDAGGFDSDFWAHMEEIDLCWRLKNMGFRIMYTHKSVVYHLGGGTLEYNNPKKLFLNFRNNLWLLYKNLPQNRLLKTIFSRLVLDGIAALKLLAEANLNGLASVLKAHFQYYKSISVIRLKRKFLKVNQRTSNHPEIFEASIVLKFYLEKKKKFSELNFQQHNAN